MIKNDKIRVAERRVEAKVRQDEYNALTKEQKVARAAFRRGNSKRELIRLGVGSHAES